MLWNYPSFINELEQDDSRILFNNIRFVLQTSIRELWFDIDFGTNIRSNIKRAIDPLMVSEIQFDIESNLMKYFTNDIKLNYLDVTQNLDKLLISLDYTELRTGKHNTIQTEEALTNISNIV